MKFDGINIELIITIIYPGGFYGKEYGRLQGIKII